MLVAAAQPLAHTQRHIPEIWTASESRTHAPVRNYNYKTRRPQQLAVDHCHPLRSKSRSAATAVNRTDQPRLRFDSSRCTKGCTTLGTLGTLGIKSASSRHLALICLSFALEAFTIDTNSWSGHAHASDFTRLQVIALAYSSSSSFLLRLGPIATRNIVRYQLDTER